MRDRFPLLLIAGLLLLGVLGAALVRGAARGEIAGPLSTYRSERTGARALYLLAQESGLPVEREKRDLSVIDPDVSLVLLGVAAGMGTMPAEGESLASRAEPDGGTPAPEEEGVVDLQLEPLPSEVLTEEERTRLLEHVQAGHVLVYVPPAAGVDALLEAAGVSAKGSPTGTALRTLVPAQPSPFTLGVERVEAEVKSFLDFGEQAIPLLRDDNTGEVVATVSPYGRGRIIVLGAPELAMNEALARADNARFWLSLLSAAAGSDRLLFDEYHHGFRDERSLAAFAVRYRLHLAIGQLLLGLCLWAASLRRFGRPRAPPPEARVGGVDMLAAAGRLYRAGGHHTHAAQLIADGLALALAPPAGLSLRSRPDEVEAGLRARGRKDLAAGLAEVYALARVAASEGDVLKVARQAARVRQRLKPRRGPRPLPEKSRTPNPTRR